MTTAPKSFLLVYVLVVVAVTVPARAQLMTSDFYENSCPGALDVIGLRSVVKRAIYSEKRMGASLLRLHFHDCFVNVRKS